MDIDFHDHTPLTGPIVQILPAEPGWEAVYAAYDVNQEKIVTMRLPLACWAVIESEPMNKHNFLLIGMVRHGSKLIFLRNEIDNGEMTVGEPPPTFLGYSYPNCETYWDEVAEQTYRERKQKREEKESS